MSDNPKIRRRLRCPSCGSLDALKWGVRNGVQRYKCRNCQSLFSASRVVSHLDKGTRHASELPRNSSRKWFQKSSRKNRTTFLRQSTDTGLFVQKKGIVLEKTSCFSETLRFRQANFTDINPDRLE